MGETLLGKGSTFVPFEGDDFQFTLIQNEDINLQNQTFDYCLVPMERMVSIVRSNLTVTKDKLDSSLILLRFKDINPLKGVEFVNLLMDRYKSYLKEETKRLSQEQLAFLERRKKKQLPKIG